jgi:hypothetical protein
VASTPRSVAASMSTSSQPMEYLATMRSASEASSTRREMVVL